MRNLVVACVVLLAIASPAAAGLKTNETAPVFSLPDGANGTFSLAEAKLEGKAVVLNFFASWCPSCRSELQLFNGMADELKSRGVTVVLIGVREGFGNIGSLLSELHVDKPVVLSDADGRVAGRYQVRVFPTTFFIGSDGKVKDIVYGAIESRGEFGKSIDKLISR